MRMDRMNGEQRLMSANETARYLGISYWTLRDLVWSNVLPMVRLPNKSGGTCRKILIDKRDLDLLIEKGKESF
jgi:excisionase family DNA binding protein